MQYNARDLGNKFVDLIWTINGYSGKEFLRSEVFELPFVHTNDLGGNRSHQSCYA